MFLKVFALFVSRCGPTLRVYLYGGKCNVRRSTHNRASRHHALEENNGVAIIGNWRLRGTLSGIRFRRGNLGGKAPEEAALCGDRAKYPES